MYYNKFARLVALWLGALTLTACGTATKGHDGRVVRYDSPSAGIYAVTCVGGKAYTISHVLQRGSDKEDVLPYPDTACANSFASAASRASAEGEQVFMHLVEQSNAQRVVACRFMRPVQMKKHGNYFSISRQQHDTIASYFIDCPNYLVQPGISGSPVLDRDGKVLGLVYAGFMTNIFLRPLS